MSAADSKFSPPPRSSPKNTPRTSHDSSSSSDGSQSGSSSPGGGGDKSRYKSELCRGFQERGHCPYGSKCQFAHGADELRAVNRHPKYKTTPCANFTRTGSCPYGQRCHFLHTRDDPALIPPALYKQQTGHDHSSQQGDAETPTPQSNDAHQSPSPAEIKEESGWTSQLFNIFTRNSRLEPQQVTTRCSNQVNLAASSFAPTTTSKIPRPPGLAESTQEMMSAVESRFAEETLPKGSEYDLKWLEKRDTWFPTALNTFLQYSDAIVPDEEGEGGAEVSQSFFSQEKPIYQLPERELVIAEEHKPEQETEFKLFGVAGADGGYGMVTTNIIDALKNFG